MLNAIFGTIGEDNAPHFNSLLYFQQKRLYDRFICHLTLFNDSKCINSNLINHYKVYKLTFFNYKYNFKVKNFSVSKVNLLACNEFFEDCE